MFHCPYCKHPAHTRTSRYVPENLRQRYHQCTSLECSATFRTSETLDGVIRQPAMPENAGTLLTAGERP
ncbi:ogr/Delta-like zinc finger family protein [Cronobacter sakazakii]|uniref:ogr/Delta-like zinc finger family protein n=1 Tax=Cronobacter sakazakii TaxID=28141 RepID=UPI0002EE4BA7|nr:ogr/Delta-like zinc finger family protein [Cronobacter sakazakii]ELY2553965.1 ogr/Delta-like zinc finger family protein [Cronobacter sakazakii]ELY6403722.1 ogr/Delta-like zinc finger family protein [Cronobacter sakazakii]MBF4817061.1 ogr/Delta-like zinc finger family protein [Cronobacter sakazakii]NCH67003.1 transcriptional regulator [Cronobacter sakazakii]PQY63456.1 transcriptional regulator [Cronobacter sakazakii]